jgi:hypothetical protein
VVSQEFTDAMKTLDWTNSVALPMSRLEDQEEGDGDEELEEEEDVLVEAELGEDQEAEEELEEEEQRGVEGAMDSVEGEADDSGATVTSSVEDAEVEEVMMVIEEEEVVEAVGTSEDSKPLREVIYIE